MVQSCKPTSSISFILFNRLLGFHFLRSKFGSFIIVSVYEGVNELEIVKRKLTIYFLKEFFDSLDGERFTANLV